MDNGTTNPSALGPSPTQRTTFAQRNSDKDILLIRHHKKATTDANIALCKATSALARKALANDLEAFIAECKSTLDLLAAKHSVSEESICQSITTAMVYKKHHAPNLANAILSDKMARINKDISSCQILVPGEHLKLKDIKSTIANDAIYQDLSDDMLYGVAIDVQSSIGRVQHEMASCAYRMGVVGFSLFSRGHLKDQAIPECVDVEGTLDFFPEALNMNVVKHPQEDRNAMRKEAMKAIVDGLECITHHKVHMNYNSFDSTIKSQHHIQIVGWPKGVEFRSPSDIGSTKDLHALRNALRSRACYWVRMSKQEVEEFEKELAQGEKKTQKTHKDKGTKRRHIVNGEDGGKEDNDGKDGGKDDNEQEEHERPPKQKKTGVTKNSTAKKATRKKGAAGKAVGKESGSSKGRGKHLQGMLPPKSREFIDSDDDSEDAADLGGGPSEGGADAG
ncbi:hypothetical protein ARMGADRAFT_1036642 [Armillaria gallica]|uniref:Uncharacterized protein n=1 Tax=Armillaria gallica TaxID=47427 RepID=A0A2H3CTI1_ARMGA|nr:hypothetical protein ARMGADRAFT_1036642 [Armillaria gallica]